MVYERKSFHAGYLASTFVCLYSRSQTHERRSKLTNSAMNSTENVCLYSRSQTHERRSKLTNSAMNSTENTCVALALLMSTFLLSTAALKSMKLHCNPM